MQPTNNPVQQAPRLAPMSVHMCLIMSILFLTQSIVNATQDSPNHEHHIPHRSALRVVADEDIESLNTQLDGGYMPEFAYLDRSLIGRQTSDIQPLIDDEDRDADINPGTSLYFVLRNSGQRRKRSADEHMEIMVQQDAKTLITVRNSPEEQDGEEDPTEVEANVAHMERRQSNRQVYISANTCRQPKSTGNGTINSDEYPSLSLYISSQTQNQKPGPNANEGAVQFVGGYANISLQTDSDVYIGISAPSLSPNWVGSWHFEVAASTNSLYHIYDASQPFLFLIDTDSDSALFITPNLTNGNTSNAPGALTSSAQLTDQLMQQNPFKMFAYPDGTGGVAGMEHSFCAIKQQFNINSTQNLTISTNITTKFKDTKSIFHVQGLDAGKTYNGFVVVEQNSLTNNTPGVGSVRGGGIVFQAFNWTTKADTTCQVLFDLEFCDSVAYAVPSNSTLKTDDNALKNIYDSIAKAYYQNFTRSLAQVACDTQPEAQYSLAQNCTTCARAYKDWLCNVLIPRCDDFSSPNPWLQPRNVDQMFSNQSLPFAYNMTKEFNDTLRDRKAFKARNSVIDDQIKPGPYKELKPCEDLCFEIVRNCPAQLQFNCPNDPALSLTYGKKDPNDQQLMCNFPGAVVKLNIDGMSVSVRPRLGSIALGVLVAVFMLWG